MTKRGWSGWMQAVFSVVAIFARSCVAWLLFTAEVQERRDEDIRVEADKLEDLLHLAASAIPSRMLRLDFSPLHRDVMVARTAIDKLVTDYEARNAWSEFCDPHLRSAGEIVVRMPPQLKPFQDRLAELKKRLKP